MGGFSYPFGLCWQVQPVFPSCENRTGLQGSSPRAFCASAGVIFASISRPPHLSHPQWVAFHIRLVCAGKCSQHFRPVKTTQDSKVRVPERFVRVLAWSSPVYRAHLT